MTRLSIYYFDIAVVFETDAKIFPDNSRYHGNFVAGRCGAAAADVLDPRMTALGATRSCSPPERGMLDTGSGCRTGMAIS